MNDRGMSGSRLDGPVSPKGSGMSETEIGAGSTAIQTGACAEAPRASEGEPDRAIHASARIMIVDDEPTCVKIVCKYLKDAGYRDFLTTTDSTRALELIAEANPDILLLDYVMPEVDGLEILSRRAEDTGLRRIPVLVLTASRDEAVKFKALKLGASDFLSKPIDPNDLLPRVHNLLTMKADQDRMSELNAKLEEKVLEQTEALRKAYDDLKSFDRLKQDFLTLVSHELRTPVAGIHGSLELLMMNLIEEKAERDEMLKVAVDQTRRLQHIIDDVEQFLTLTAGKVNPERDLIDLGKLLEERSAVWAPQAGRKGLGLRVDVEAAPAIWSDNGLIINSLDRLVENAIKFTEQGGIVVSARAAGDHAIIEVTDTGRGIEAGQNKVLLKPLSIGEKIEHHQEGGGLGLAIIFRQMQLLGGWIEFESDGKDKGSTFRLFIPLGWVRPPSIRA